MKARVLLSAMLLFVFQLVIAQQKIELSGKVVAKDTDEALPYANIAAFAPNDSLTAGTLSDDKGRFSLTCDCSDGCYLLINYLGMEPVRIMAKQWQGTRYNLGKIALNPLAVTLESVTVSNATPIIDRRIDRTVVKIEETRKSTAHTIYDILRAMPGLAVDEEGNMRYNGATPSVYVDNSPSELLYPLLENIPVDRIENIELIDASVRQSGDGRGGIINIKLRAADEGFSGSLSTKPSTYNFKEINDSKNAANLNYKQKEFIWIANASFNTTDNSWSYKMSKDFRNAGIPAIVNEEQAVKNRYRVSGNSIGFIFQPNDYTKLTVAGSYSYSSSAKTIYRKATEQSTETLAINNQYEASSDDHQRSSPNYGIGISFYRQFRKSSSHLLNISAYVSSYNDHFYGDYSEIHRFKDTIAIDSTYTEHFSNKLSKKPAVFVSVFYNNPLTDRLNWSTSYQFDGTFNRRSESERYTNDISLDLKNQKHMYNSAYSFLSSSLTYLNGNWRLTGGLALEDKAFNGHFDYFSEAANDFEAQWLRKSYLRVIPSTTLRYSPSWKHNFSLTLANTWEYPSFEEMNDFIDKRTNYQWTQGNSKLKPSPNYSVYLKYETYRDNWGVSPSLFIQFQDNLASGIPIQIDPLNQLLYRANIAQQIKTGINLSAYFNIKKLEISLYSNIYYTQFQICDGQTYEGIDLSAAYTNNHAIKGYAYCELSYKIKSVNLNCELDYWNTGFDFNGNENDYFTLSINASRKFLKRRLLVNIGINNLLKNLSPNKQHSENLDVITDSEIYGYYNQPMFNLSLRYNFRYGSRRTDSVQGMRYF